MAATKLVLFDLVGTLLDERSDHEALDGVMALVRDRWHLEDSPQDLSGMFALAVMEIIGHEPDVEEPAEFVSFSEAAPDVFGGLMHTLGYQVSDDDKTWFWAKYMDIQREVWRPNRGAVEAVRAIKETGALVGVITDADAYMLYDILPRTDLDEHIDVRVSAQDVGFVKPHRAIFDRVLQEAGATAVETVVVGDSLERDIDGAEAYGITRTVLFDEHDARISKGQKVQHLKELPGTLRNAGWFG